MTRIKVDNAWKEANEYVKVNGVWKPCHSQSKVSGAWKSTGGSVQYHALAFIDFEVTKGSTVMNNHVRIYNFNQSTQSYSLNNATLDGVNTLKFSPSGEYLMMLRGKTHSIHYFRREQNGNYTLFNVNFDLNGIVDMRAIGQEYDYKKHNLSIDFSPDNKWCAIQVAGDDAKENSRSTTFILKCTNRQWTYHKTLNLDTNSQSMGSCSFSPNGRYLIANGCGRWTDVGDWSGSCVYLVNGGNFTPHPQILRKHVHIANEDCFFIGDNFYTSVNSGIGNEVWGYITDTSIEIATRPELNQPMEWVTNKVLFCSYPRVEPIWRRFSGKSIVQTLNLDDNDEPFIGFYSNPTATPTGDKIFYRGYEKRAGNWGSAIKNYLIVRYFNPDNLTFGNIIVKIPETSSSKNIDEFNQLCGQKSIV